ncbi:uncharacterized protein BDZ99DRAFT_494497 [Mytilinidion resinicola]|uniref:Uncharacterized protein n=1 Tax=Mytilinidion resinicola TaxID=574789 RepID=A0A6A6Z1B9_9PEZI|nr:uncharacterized protein BDZ99DRAFT_494497 [Mytilinidion resinicola]KAF2814519.1 hypothetical protein BDZ99DRAFT_494497 [Mytilinidion resinicola]
MSYVGFLKTLINPDVKGIPFTEFVEILQSLISSSFATATEARDRLWENENVVWSVLADILRKAPDHFKQSFKQACPTSSRILSFIMEHQAEAAYTAAGALAITAVGYLVAWGMSRYVECAIKEEPQMDALEDDDKTEDRIDGEWNLDKFFWLLRTNLILDPFQFPLQLFASITTLKRPTRMVFRNGRSSMERMEMNCSVGSSRTKLL